MKDQKQRLFGVTGWKNSGKTTLVCALVQEITGRGYSVSTVKHAHKTFDMDHEGRDSHKHRLSGASEVAIVSQNRWAILNELRGKEEPPLSEMLGKLDAVDLILIEGFKREAHPKIECRRLEACSQEPIFAKDPSIVALASDRNEESDLPQFNLNDVSAMADFVLFYVGLTAFKATEKA